MPDLTNNLTTSLSKSSQSSSINTEEKSTPTSPLTNNLKEARNSSTQISTNVEEDISFKDATPKKWPRLLIQEVHDAGDRKKYLQKEKIVTVAGRLIKTITEKKTPSEAIKATESQLFKFILKK